MKINYSFLFPVCSFLFSAGLAYGQILTENFESHAAGTGNYSGNWSFIHTDATFGGNVATLDIAEGVSPGVTTGSPASGNYLSYTPASGGWAGEIVQYYDVGTEIYTTRTRTSEAWKSPVGHFHRQVMLNAGQSYNVSLWRYISLEGSGSSSAAFSIWDGSSVNTVTPFASTPGSLLNMQSYNLVAGDWQLVTLGFTAPGTSGSGTVPVDFMMGIYSSTEVPSTYFTDSPYGSAPELDGNTRTVDAMPPDWGSVGASSGITETFRLGLDGFSISSITPVPEPGAAGFALVSLLGLAARRRRRQ